jgi:ATP-dependent Clp protease ATP-binding subunit ClpB
MSPSQETTTLRLERYSRPAKSLVAGAQALADERKHAEVQPLHLLVSMLERSPGAVEVLRKAGAGVVELKAASERALAELPRSNEPAYLSPAMLDLLERAQREAERDRTEALELEHLLNALSQEIRGAAGELLSAYGIAPGSLRQHMAVLRQAAAAVEPASAGGAGERFTRDLVSESRQRLQDPVIGRALELRRLLTILERRHKSHPLLVGEPGVGKGAIIRGLSQRLASGDVPTSLAGMRLLELDAGALVAGARLRGEIEERVRLLVKQLCEDGGDTLLVTRSLEQLFGQGPSGSAVGELLKPALLRGELRLLATTTPEGLKRIEERDAPMLRLLTVLPIEEPSLERATEVVRGLAGRFEKHHEVEITEGAIVAATRLAKRYVQDRFLPDSAIDLLDEAAAARRVETDGVPVEVDELLARRDALKAQLASLAGAEDAASVAARQRMQTELDALEPRVDESRRELESRRGVVAAVRTLHQELTRARAERDQAHAEQRFAKLGELEHVTIPDLERRLQAAEATARSAGVTEGERTLDEEGVAKTLAQWTGIPVARMLEGEAEKLLRMEERLAQRVVGQHDAVNAISRAVRRGRVGLRDPGRPIGSFLFLGPSGVGKTELAKALAAFLFDDEQALTRLDMSEFMERHMAQRLIGAPPGYADSEQGGFLTESVRRRPYSVLLFDEVEKAHQDVFNLLLQVLDDGRLTDGRGRTADFSNTVVIMTSNTGSDRILETDARLFESEEGREALREVLLDRLHQFFRPEFLNRIDDVVVFRPLTREVLRQIVDIQLTKLDKLLADRSVRLEVSEEAKLHLVELGYEPALGARPLRRAILRHIQDPLAETLLAGGYEGAGVVRVTLEDGEFRLAAEKSQA